MTKSLAFLVSYQNKFIISECIWRMGEPELMNKNCY